MRALHAVVNSAVALLLVSVAMGAAPQRRKRRQHKVGRANACDVAAASSAQNRKSRMRQRLQKRSRCTYRSAGRSFSIPKPGCAGSSISNPDVLETTTISATQLVVTAKAARKQQPGACGMKARTPILWMSTADVDVSGLRDDVQIGLSPANPCRLKLNREESSQSEKSQAKQSADGVLQIASRLLQERCRFPGNRAEARKTDHAQGDVCRSGPYQARAVRHQRLQHGCWRTL